MRMIALAVLLIAGCGGGGACQLNARSTAGACPPGVTAAPNAQTCNDSTGSTFVCRNGAGYCVVCNGMVGFTDGCTYGTGAASYCVHDCSGC
jgi:hypothetical protein